MLQLLLPAGIMALMIALVVYQVHKIRWLRDHGRRVTAMVTSIQHETGKTRWGFERDNYYVTATWTSPRTGRTYTFWTWIMNSCPPYRKGSLIPVVIDPKHPELFWGLRGGGGNFGVVTEFEFRLHPISGQALAVECFFPLEAAEAALQRWRDLIPTAPRQATLTAWTGTASETSFLPPEVHGQHIASIGYVWVGDPDEGRQWLPSLRSDSSPLAERTRELTYVDLQRMDDNTGQEHGVRRYWKGHYLRELSDEAIQAFLTRGMDGLVTDEDAAMMPSVSLQCYGGAIVDVADDETAFSHRKALAECVISARWTNPTEDTQRIEIARRYAQSLSPFASGGYIHAVADEGQAGTLRAYAREKLARLTALKDRYDPENVFHLNQNIRPSSHNQA